MMIKRTQFDLLLFFVMSLMLIGCAARPSSMPDADGTAGSQLSKPSAYEQHDITPDDRDGDVFTEKQLRDIQEKIQEFGEELQKKHNYQILLLGVEQERILLMIRRTGDVERPITKEEQEQVRLLLFDQAAGLFHWTYPFTIVVKAAISKGK